MKGMTIRRAVQICGGELLGRGGFDTELGKVVIDSRAVEPGDFFVAYKGERADGHDYISAAFDRGAVCCLAQRVPEGETRPILLVCAGADLRRIPPGPAPAGDRHYRKRGQDLRQGDDLRRAVPAAECSENG